MAIAPKVTAATAAAAAAVLAVWGIQSTGVDQLDGVVGNLVTLVMAVLAPLVAGYVKADTNPAPSSMQTLMAKGWLPPAHKSSTDV